MYDVPGIPELPEIIITKDSREIKGQIADRLDVSGSGGNRDVISPLIADNRPQLLPGTDPDQHRFITLFHDLGDITLFEVSIIF